MLSGTTTTSLSSGTIYIPDGDQIRAWHPNSLSSAIHLFFLFSEVLFCVFCTQPKRYIGDGKQLCRIVYAMLPHHPVHRGRVDLEDICQRNEEKLSFSLEGILHRSYLWASVILIVRECVGSFRTALIVPPARGGDGIGK